MLGQGPGKTAVSRDCHSSTKEQATMDLVIGDLTALDFDRGFLDTIGSLSDPELSRSEAVKVFQHRLRNGVKTYVARYGDRVVGTLSLLVEQKFIHGGGRVAHVEDVAVHRDYQGKGIGTVLVEHATAAARERRSY